MNIIGNIQMAGNPGTAAYGTAPPYLRATGNTDATGDGGMGANADIVANLNLVIQLYAVFEHRIFNRAAVDRGIRTDLDIIPNTDSTELRHLDPYAVVVGQSESVTAEHNAGMYQRTLTDSHPATHRHVGKQAAIVTDGYVRAYDATRTDIGVPTDDHPGLNNGVRPNKRGVIDIAATGDAGSRVYPG